MSNNPVQGNAEGLLPIDEIIHLLKERGVSFGKGNPKNRLRYYATLGLIPPARRAALKGSITSSGKPKIVGHYPSSVVDKLIEINEKIKDGHFVRSIKQPEKEISEEEAKNVDDVIGLSNPISLTPSIETPGPLPSPEPTFTSKGNNPYKVKRTLLASALLLFIVGITITSAYNLPYTNKLIQNNILSDVLIPFTSSIPKQLSQDNSIGSILARTTSPYLKFNVDTEVSGILNAFGGIFTGGENANLGAGELTASNVLYDIIAGDNVTITTGQTPTISVPDAGSGVGSVTGTTGRITVTGTANPTVNIATNYTGQTSITTLGTIGTGTWNGTALTDAFVSDTLSIDGTGSVNWGALNTFPIDCAATDFVRGIGTTLTCAADGSGSATLQDVYNNGNNITTTDARDIEFNLADSATDADFLIDLLGTGNIFEVSDGGTAFLTLSNGQTITTSMTSSLEINGSLDLPGSGITGAGAGSGLDADLLDGVTSANFLRSNTSDNFTSGTLTTNAGTTLDIDGTLAWGGATISESLDMSSNLITNIGSTGTDFTSGGGLNIADVLNVNGDVNFSLGGAENFTLTNTTFTDGAIASFTGSSTSIATKYGIYGDFNWGGSLSTEYGLYLDVEANGAFGSGGFGSYIDITSTTPIGSGTENIYGGYFSATNNNDSGGIGNTYGVYSTVTGDPDGTTNAYAFYATATGADNNYGLYVSAGDAYVAGHGAFGSSAGVDKDQVITITESNSTALVLFDGIDVSVNGTAAGAQTIRGINILSQYSGTSGASNVYGLDARAYYSSTSGTATVTDLAALSVDISTVGSTAGAVTNSYGLQIGDAQIGGGSITPTSSYGVRIGDQSVAGITNTYGIYIEDQANSTNNYALYLEGTGGTASTGITFGADTNLYRAAVNTLETDDRLRVNELVIFGGFWGETLTFDETASDNNLYWGKGNDQFFISDANNNDAGGATFRWQVNGLGGFGGTEIMRLEESGDLYIGEDSTSDDDTLFFDGAEYLRWDNSPGEFDLSDDLHITSGANAQIIIENGAVPRGNIIGIRLSDNIVIGADEDNAGGASYIQFRVDATDVVQINSSGDLSIGDGSAADDDTIFFDQLNESVHWDNANADFEFSAEINVTGTGQSDIAGDLSIAGEIGIGSSPPQTGWGVNAQFNTVGGSCFLSACIGGIFGPNITTSSPSGYAAGIFSRIQTNGDGITLPVSYSVFAGTPAVGGGDTITTAYGLYVADQNTATNDYGIYVEGADTYALWVDDDNVRFDEDLLVGEGSAADDDTIFFDASNESIHWDDANADFELSAEINVTGTAQSDIAGTLDVAGEIAVGSGSVVRAGWGISSSGSTVGGSCFLTACVSGLFDQEIITSAPAGYAAGVFGRVRTANTSFTLTNAYALSAWNPVKGAASTITNNYGLHIADLTAGTNDYGIYVAGADTYALWVDSDTTRLDGATAFGAQATLAVDDTTPDVSAATSFITANTVSTLINDFNAGAGSVEPGHLIFVEVNDANTDFDCTTSGLNCGITDITTVAAGDFFTWYYDGTDWHLVSFMDDSDNQNAGSGFDIAEWFPASEELEPGDLVSIDPDSNTANSVMKSESDYDSKLIGIVSTNPGLTLGEPAEGFAYPVALTGRVPTKVSTENGDIQHGDPLTSSSAPGVAMKATKSGSTVGKALESYSGSGVVKIITFVSVGWYVEPFGENSATPLALGELPISLNEFGSIQIDGDLVVTGDINLTGNLTLDGTVTASEVATKNLKILASNEPTTGNSSIKSGKLIVKVNSSSLTSGSKVFITPTTLTGGQSLSVTDKKPGDHFTVEIESVHSKDIHFDWWVVN